MFLGNWLLIFHVMLFFGVVFLQFSLFHLEMFFLSLSALVHISLRLLHIFFSFPFKRQPPPKVLWGMLKEKVGEELLQNHGVPSYCQFRDIREGWPRNLSKEVHFYLMHDVPLLIFYPCVPIHFLSPLFIRSALFIASFTLLS